VTRVRSVLLATVVVLSAVVGAVGPALAHTATDSGPVQYEYTGGAETLVIDTSALDAGTDFTVEYTTMEGPGSPTVLARETYNTANLDGDELWFYNEGAYDTVNVTVSAYSGGEPAFETRGVATSLNLQKTVVGSTGGDSDVTCDTAEKISSLTGGYDQLDCMAQPGSTAVNTTGIDASETRIELYKSTLNQKSANDNYHNTLNNYLSDTKTQARIIGKNAYIKALNDGDSKSVAKQEAKQAVSDYYTKKQQNLNAQWQTTTELFATNQQIATDTTNIDPQYLTVKTTAEDSDADTRYAGLGTTTLTTTNGTSIDSNTISIDIENTVQGETKSYNGHALTDGEFNGHASGCTACEVTADGLEAQAHSTADGPATAALFTKFANEWSEIENQNTQVQNDMDTLAENTYSAYQQGEINSSDLVDPYVLANERSAGDNFETWSAAQLTLLGQNTTDNMDSAGEFEVETGDGTIYEGILTSPSNPASGQFEADTTYNTADIDGSQMVITEDRIVELDGEFTLGNITTNSGENVQNATIQKVQYETTNITELKQQYEDLAYRRAELEAREQAMKQAGGGGLLGGESVNTTAAIVIVALVLALGIINN